MTRWKAIRWGLIAAYGMFAYAFHAVAASAPLFLLLAVLLLVLAVACWLASGLVRLVTKWQPGRGIVFLRWSGVALAFSVAGLLGGFVFPPPAVSQRPLPVTEELHYMLETDQADRFRPLRWFVMADRDRQRLERTKALYEKGEIVTPQDKFHAALIFQHGGGTDDSTNFEKAYHLATDSSDAGVAGADWLKNAAYDRWMMSLGKPQVHGTQLGFQVRFP